MFITHTKDKVAPFVQEYSLHCFCFHYRREWENEKRKQNSRKKENCNTRNLR